MRSNGCSIYCCRRFAQDWSTLSWVFKYTIVCNGLNTQTCPFRPSVSVCACVCVCVARCVACPACRLATQTQLQIHARASNNSSPNTHAKTYTQRVHRMIRPEVCALFCALLSVCEYLSVCVCTYGTCGACACVAGVQCS